MRACRLSAVAVACVALAGCQGTQQRARQEATQRWNRARSEVKARLAADQLESGNASGAAGELSEAYRLDPDNPALVPLRVRVWLAQGETASAAELLDTTRGQQRPTAELEYLLGIVRQQQQQWGDALKAYLRAADLDGGNVVYVTAVAQAYLQLGQPQAALEFLTSRSASLEWTDAYQATLAECQEQLGDFSAAASAWRSVTSAEGLRSEIGERVAVALYRSGRYGEAIPVLVETLAQAEEDGAQSLRLMLAECYLAQGRYSDARDQAQLILRRDKDDVRALRLLARSLGATGEYEAGLRAARRALDADASDLRTLELAAALALRTGDSKQAGIMAERLLAREPDNPVALRILKREPDVRASSPE